MTRLDIFPVCRMRAFASMVSQRMGVQVRLRGREISVKFGKPPVIWMPNLEMAREEDLLPLYGFLLHESAHLCHTDPNVVRDCPNYMLKMLHNAIEDVFIEGRLERDFPGARDMLVRSYVEGIKRVCDGKPIVPEASFLSPEGRPAVLSAMSSMGMDVDDDKLVEDVAKRLEIDRAAKLWIVERRGYPLPLYDWPNHPWRQVFNEETTPPAKSTKQAYEQAQRIIERLGVAPVLPGDHRPVDVVREAGVRRSAATEARRALRNARSGRSEEIERLCSETMECNDLREKRAASDAAAEAAKRAEEAAEGAKLSGWDAEKAERDLANALDALRDARAAENEAREALDGKRREIAAEVSGQRAPEIGRLKAEAREKVEVARAAADAATKALAEIKARDEKVDASVDKETLDKIVKAVLERFKEEALGDELGAPAVDAEPEAAAARKYTPFDRSMDHVDAIAATAEARAEYDRARRKYAALISETAERLRRLRSPKLSRLRVNADRGRLDPRQAYKVGLAARGAAVDLTRVWRTIDERMDANVAVSLLIDCSGSMRAPVGSGTRISLARQAAVCLSEVMSALKIPHEILGHTTRDEDAPLLGLAPEDLCQFSRFVPFQGYAFKAFGENCAPEGVFSEVPMACNLDGEALLWAAGRLADRKERTKLLIVICDGLPDATMSVRGELERHLYVTAKRIETCEGDGLHLAALGIGEERVRRYYKNSEVLSSVGDLPTAVLGIVERAMSGGFD